jgi:acyl-CoA thioester hydrolase
MTRDKDNVLAASGEFVGMHIDMKTRKSVPFPEESLQKLKILVKEHEKLDWQAPVCGVMGVR